MADYEIHGVASSAETIMIWNGPFGSRWDLIAPGLCTYDSGSLDVEFRGNVALVSFKDNFSDKENHYTYVLEPGGGSYVQPV